MSPLVVRRKVAWRILPLIFVLYVIAYLDRANVGFAKLRMQEELHFSDEVFGWGFGIFFAAANWLPDVWTRWVYVFTLPVPRPRLALIRLAAGIVLMTPAVLALWVAGVVASRMADLPSVVEAHPGAIALRFGAATLVSYALTSLLVLMWKRVWYLGLALILLVVVQALGVDFGFSITDTLFLHSLSPLHVFAGQWLLLDV